MNSSQFLHSRLGAMLLVFAMLVACGRNPLPEVPVFEKLGFEDALDEVHKQVFSAYERWHDKPRDADRNGQLGMLLSAYGKNASAEILYRRARILAPGEFRWAYFLAITTQELGRHEDAIAMYQEALKIKPNNFAARIKLAALLLQVGKVEQSVDWYKAIVAENPTAVEGLLGLGKAHHRMGDLDAATDVLQRARIVGPQYGEVHYALAAVLAASGDDEAAADEFAAYERTATNSIRTPDPLMAEAIRLNAGDGPHMAKADYQMQRGQYEGAITSFRAALSINPVNQDAWCGLINSLAERGNIDQAGDVYRDALTAGISYHRLHTVYGRALIRHQQFDAARDVIGKAIELDPLYADALVAMGELEMQSGANMVAVEQFRRALAVVPNDRHIMLLLTQALNASGQFEEAATRLESLASDAAANTFLAMKELAIAYHGLDRTDKAIEVLQRARVTAKTSADVLQLQSIEKLITGWQRTTP